ncbi:MAG: right-handed parallel beta-helix repeat-containing protein [Thermoguttaceae bacterium]|jgi:parallel beta-helix repeat protein|nr:right-handed parallel beta-helix repeat-containing protein [Thermoguttaceae bacterium]
MNCNLQHLFCMLLTLAGLLGLNLGKADAATFYVATNGNDAWSGKLAEPNAAGDDGPLATLAAARDAVRKLKATGPLDEPVSVQIRGGVYYVTETIALDAGDSGAEGAVISYEAYPGETPELVGGRRVEGFRPAGGNMLSVQLPAVEAGEWSFRQLFVNGRRQVRARYPNFDPDDPIRGGFLYVAHSRSGFGLTVGNIHNPGDWTEYQVNIPADGEYVLWVYYGALNAPHGTTDMSGRTVLTVDGGEPIPLIDLADTPNWAASRWARAATVPLKQGERVLRWQNVRGGGLTLDAFIVCDDPGWKPAGPVAPEAPEGKHAVLFQAEDFTASHGRQLTVGGSGGGSKTEFHYAPGEFKPAWADAPDAELHIFQSGSCRAFKEILGIEGVDEATHTVTVGGPEAVAGLNTGDRYFVENVFEELDAPGEWYLDRGTGVLSFIPPEGFTDACEVVAPAVGRIIEIDGASHLRFAGLLLRNGDYTPQDGCGGYGMGNNGTVYLGDARHCTVEGCTFTQTGRYAVCISGGGDNVVRRNDISHSAQGGVLILGSARNEIVDNLILDCGAVYKHIGGVVLQGKGTGDNRVAHNHIERMSRYGITMKSAGLRNVIEYNRVHWTNLETYDTGGIEVTQHDRTLRSGSAIRYNIVGDSVGWYAQGPDRDVHMSWGIYLDSFAGGYTVTNNITYRNSHGGIMLQGGQGNTVVNNIFVESTLAQGYFPNFQDNSIGQTLTRNIFYYTDPEAILIAGGNLTPEVLRVDHNLYYCPGAETPRMRVRGIASFERWQERGFDRNSVIADPLFEDVAQDNYTLRPGSPACDLGFETIDTGRIGLLTPRPL